MPVEMQNWQQKYYRRLDPKHDCVTNYNNMLKSIHVHLPEEVVYSGFNIMVLTAFLWYVVCTLVLSCIGMVSLHMGHTYMYSKVSAHANSIDSYASAHGF